MRSTHALMILAPVLLALLVIVVVMRMTGARAGDVVPTSEPVPAVETSLVREGRTIAEAWCAACHAIASDAPDTVLSDAPSFMLLAEEPYLDGPTLRRLREAPHPAMPEFPLTARSADALAAYISSVRSDEPYDPYKLWGDER